MIPLKHRPQFNTEEIIKHYSEKDQTDISYVCTSSLIAETKPVDIFYRETPHPTFGNRYFGLYWQNKQLMICNADMIEQLDFGVIKVNGEYHYSQHRHDFNQITEDAAIDGGRQYVRVIGKEQFTIMRIRNGKFVTIK